MFNMTLRDLVLAGLLWSVASFATAGSFTPIAGTTIRSGSVTVEWTSTSSQQWVRAYNNSGTRIFDSGRLASRTGSVQISVAAGVTALRVVFHEKSSTGEWLSIERTYSVNAGSIDGSTTGGGTTVGGGTTTGGGSSQDTLAGLSCTIDQIAKYNGSAWVCAEDNYNNTEALSTQLCEDFETLVRQIDGSIVCTSDCLYQSYFDAYALSPQTGGIKVSDQQNSCEFVGQGDNQCDRLSIETNSDGSSIKILEACTNFDYYLEKYPSYNAAQTCAIFLGCVNY